MALSDDSTPSAPTTHDVLVRRSPRIVRFMLVGVVLAIVITLILTFSFPETPNYSQAQVFGFVGIILVTVFVGLSALVAVLVDRASTRRARTVTMSSELIAARREIEADDFENEGAENEGTEIEGTEIVGAPEGDDQPRA